MKRSVTLDLARIFAIALVFIAHIGQTVGHSSGAFFGFKNFYYVSLGGLGVSLFIVLSGVLVGLGASGRSDTYLNFLYRRLKRIYPMYWLSLPFAVAGYLLATEFSKPLFPNGIWQDLALGFTGLYAWFGLWGGPYNPPTWFIALILSLYLISPLIIQLIRRGRLPGLVLLLLISVIARLYVGRYGVPFEQQSLFDQAEAWVYRQYGFMPGRPGDWFLFCRVFEFGLGVYLAQSLPSVCWRPSLISKLSGIPIIFWLSEMSFPLFLVHYPFLYLIEEFNQLGLHISLSIIAYLLVSLLLAVLLNWLTVKMSPKS